MMLFWYLLVAELFLGGNGHYIEMFGLALRTWILLVFLVFFFFQKNFRVSKTPVPIIAIGLAVCIGVATGLFNGHDPRFIIQDAIPFAFFLLLFPAREFVTPDRYPTYQKLIKAYLVLAAAMSLTTLFLFSSGISVLQDPYYKWFRDVAGGKITDVGNHFFRIVLPEHLLLAPALLFLTALLIRHPKQKKIWLWFTLAALPFMLNLSRAYILAYLIGLGFLFSKQQWKQWLSVSVASIAMLLIVFSSLHVVASRGTSLGFELLGPRFASIANPDNERSAATRKTLLPPIWEEIKKHPVLGSGLGATISFVDPVSKEIVTTRQFDWGYLEIWTELGLLGLVSYLSLIIYLLFHTTCPARATAVALAFVGLTTPALFHVFGVVIFVFLLTQTKKPVDMIARP